MIAALYAALTVALSPLSFGPIQFRVAEALIASILHASGDTGAIYRLFPFEHRRRVRPDRYSHRKRGDPAAAWLTYKMPNIWLAAVPPVVINAIAVGIYLGLITETPVIFSIIYIGISQAVICFGIGIPLCMLLASRTDIFDKDIPPKKEFEEVDNGK